MKFVLKRTRKWIWLLQSLIVRYKKQIIIGFSVGVFAVVIGWRALPNVQATFFPKNRVVGIVGSYQPTKLPLAIQNLVSFGFTYIDEQGDVQPLLATKWEISQDGKRYFFHLAPDQYWHNGEPLTAFDVNYNFRDVVIAPADRYTLKVELEEPFVPLPNLLSRPLFKPGLVGLGEYQVVRLELNGDVVERLLLHPVDNPTTPANERMGKETIEFKFFPHLEDAVLAFQLGEIDYLENIPSPEMFTGYPNVTISEKVQYDRFLALFYNTQKEMLRTKEARQALSFAAPTLEGRKAYSPIPETSWTFNGNVKEYKHNMEQAKTLFEKAPIATNSPSLELTTFPENLKFAEEIAAQWKELGVETTVKVTQAFPSDFDVLLGVQEIPPDPDQYTLWHSTQETNITHYNNQRVDKLLEEGRKKTDKEERITIYRDFQRYLVDDAPAHFLLHPTVYTISRK